MVVVVFRARLREGVDLTRLAALGARMFELASSMPGFISYKDFAAEDGESVSVVEFEDDASVLAWHAHPEHRAVQELGRAEFFAAYHVQVCEALRERRFPIATASHGAPASS
jgi:heme-degrading monooxygenase HmoA